MDDGQAELDSVSRSTSLFGFGCNTHASPKVTRPQLKNRPERGDSKSVGLCPPLGLSQFKGSGEDCKD